MNQLLALALQKKDIFLIVGGGLAAIILLIIIFVLVGKARKRKGIKENNQIIINVVEALGGVGNIIEYYAKLSRLQLVLSDYEIVDKAKLTELGIKGIVKTSKNLTLVVGELSEEVVKYIRKNK